MSEQVDPFRNPINEAWHNAQATVDTLAATQPSVAVQYPGYRDDYGSEHPPFKALGVTLADPEARNKGVEAFEGSSGLAGTELILAGTRTNGEPVTLRLCRALPRGESPSFTRVLDPKTGRGLFNMDNGMQVSEDGKSISFPDASARHQFAPEYEGVDNLTLSDMILVPHIERGHNADQVRGGRLTSLIQRISGRSRRRFFLG